MLRSLITAVAVLTFILLFSMAVTSIDGVKKAMNPRAWKLLHRTGMHLAWLSFATTYGAAAFAHPAYAVPAALLFAIAGIRIAAWARQSRHRRAEPV